MTPHAQRRAGEFDTTPGAIHKSLHDVRVRLRLELPPEMNPRCPAVREVLADRV
jgi:hypothetical protein